MGKNSRGENVLYPTIYKNQFLCLYDSVMSYVPNRKNILGLTLNVLIIAISNRNNTKVVSDKIQDIACVKSSIKEDINITFNRSLIIDENVKEFPIETCDTNSFFAPITKNANNHISDPCGIFECVNTFMDTFIEIEINNEFENYHLNQDKVSPLDNSLKNVLCGIYSELCCKYSILTSTNIVLRILDLFYFIYNKSSMFDNDHLSASTHKMFSLIGEFLAEQDFIYEKLNQIDLSTKEYKGITIDKDEIKVFNFIIDVCDKLEKNDRIKMKDLWNRKILI